MNRYRGLIALIICVGGTTATGNDDGSLRVTGDVVDARTGEAIKHFRLIVGSPYDSIQTSWQGHLVHEYSGGHYEWHVQRAWRKTRLRIEADGYQAGISPILKRPTGQGKMRINFRLKRDLGYRGTAKNPDGDPVADAQVAVNTHSLAVNVHGWKLIFDAHDLGQGAKVISTDADGRFHLPTESDPFLIVIAHPDHGFAVFPKSDLHRGQRDIEIQLQPWCRVEAQCLDHDGDPDADAKYTLSCGWQENETWPQLQHHNSAMTDRNGRFSFTHVAPGRHRLQRWERTTVVKHWRLHAIEGQTIQLEVGGQTRTVEGTLVASHDQLPKNFDFSRLTLDIAPEADWAGVRRPIFFRGSQRVRRGLPVEENGTFVIKDLPPGAYDAFVNLDAGADGGDFHVDLHQKLRVPLVDVHDQSTYDCGNLSLLIRPKND